MEQQSTPTPPPFPYWQRPPEPSAWDKIKKALGPFAVVLVIALKFFGKLKFIILPAVKFFPLVLKTGGTMVLSIGAYALAWGVWFAVGFVLLLFVHETGHLLAARRLGLKVGAPVFIPFMGAFIAMKEAPKNAWVESQIGIGGPILGSIGAGVCYLIYMATNIPLFSALAYTGFLLNLFNLAPVGFLDGGRIVTALSPWLWLVGLAIVLGMTIMHPNFILLLILVLSAPRIFWLFRRKTDEERRYFEIEPAQRWTMAGLYFGLVSLLVLGMQMSHVPHQTVR